jgi:hypothetical protein
MPDNPKVSKALKQVIDRARRDPEFFHQLVFAPEAAMEHVPHDRALRAAIYGIGGEPLIAVLLGASRSAVSVEECSSTCGSASCTNTCGERSCGRTCSSSCGATCNHSCTNTTKVPMLSVEVRLGADEPRRRRARK